MLPFYSRNSSQIRPKSGLLGLLAALLLVLGMPSLAAAASISATGTEFFGPDLSVTLTIDDGIDPGNLVITLSVDPGANTADLRAFYAHVADESLVDGLSISGVDVTSSLFSVDDVAEVGVGTGVTVIGSPCLCDFGVAFGSAAVGGDDLQSVSFVLSHLTEDLTIDLFADQGFAVRANGVAPPTDGRRKGGAAKLSGLVVIPEPGTALLMLLGLTGLSAAGVRRPAA